MLPGGMSTVSMRVGLNIVSAMEVGGLNIGGMLVVGPDIVGKVEVGANVIGIGDNVGAGVGQYTLSRLLGNNGFDISSTVPGEKYMTLFVEKHPSVGKFAMPLVPLLATKDMPSSVILPLHPSSVSHAGSTNAVGANNKGNAWGGGVGGA